MRLHVRFVWDWMHAGTVVYKLDSSRRSDNFSGVDPIGYMCLSRIYFYHPIIPFSKLILLESWLWLLVALFSLAFYYFYWRSTLKGGGRQSALCMPCVHPLYAYSWCFGLEVFTQIESSGNTWQQLYTNRVLCVFWCDGGGGGCERVGDEQWNFGSFFRVIHGSSRCPAFDTVIVTHIFFFSLKENYWSVELWPCCIFFASSSWKSRFMYRIKTWSRFHVLLERNEVDGGKNG